MDAAVGVVFVLKYAQAISGALGGIRTPNDGSEDRCDIHFTTRAKVYYMHATQHKK